MKYEKIAGTEMEVSKICLGTMTFGTPVEEKDAVRLIHYAYDKGINFIDTANMYEGYARVAGSNGGVAEEIVGKAIQGSRDKYIVATKLGMKVGDSPEDEFTSPAAIEKQLNRSLSKLNTDYIDIYYLHKFDPSTLAQDICESMEKQRKAGKIRAWAVSNYTEPQLKALIETAERMGIQPPVMCQPKLNLINQSAADDILPLCAQSNIAVVPYQVLEGGILTGKYKRGQQPPKGSRAAEKPEWVKQISDELFDKLEKWEKDAAAQNISMSTYAMRWVLAQQAVKSALIGVKREMQIDEAISAVL